MLKLKDFGLRLISWMLLPIWFLTAIILVIALCITDELEHDDV